MVFPTGGLPPDATVTFVVLAAFFFISLTRILSWIALWMVSHAQFHTPGGRGLSFKLR